MESQFFWIPRLAGHGRNKKKLQYFAIFRKVQDTCMRSAKVGLELGVQTHGSYGHSSATSHCGIVFAIKITFKLDSVDCVK